MGVRFVAMLLALRYSRCVPEAGGQLGEILMSK